MSDSVQPQRRQPTGSPDPGILQARTLEWVAISFSAREAKFTETQRRMEVTKPWADLLEQHVDDLQTSCVNAHIERLMNEVCHPVAGVVFTDMVTDLERCSDHALNIAHALIDHTEH